MIRSSALRLAFHCPIATEIDLSRPCEVCNEKVHDLSSMTEREVRALLRQHEGERICVFYRVDANQFVELRPERAVPTSLPAVLMAATALACAPTSRQHATGDPEDELSRQRGADLVTPNARSGAWEERTAGPSEHSPPDEGQAHKPTHDSTTFVSLDLKASRIACDSAAPLGTQTSAPADAAGAASGQDWTEAQRGAASEESNDSNTIGEVIRQDFELDGNPDRYRLGGVIVRSDPLVGLGHGVKTRPTIDLIREFRERVQQRRDKRAHKRSAKQ